MTEEFYTDRDGEIHVIYLFESEIMKVPIADQDVVDMAAAARLAEFELSQQAKDE